jgi:hypothetical protein
MNETDVNRHLCEEGNGVLKKLIRRQTWKIKGKGVHPRPDWENGSGLAGPHQNIRNRASYQKRLFFR